MYPGRVLVRIGPDGLPGRRYPYTGRRNAHGREYTLADRVEALVKVTAHEVEHIARYHRGARQTEADVDRSALIVLGEFRRNRDRLMAEWMEPRSLCSAADTSEP